MNILMGLTYFRPHLSGLTVYAERLAEQLAQQGHRVTVLTSRYRRDLPRREDGAVSIHRVPVLFRLSKGVFMPGYLGAALRQVRRHDVVIVHLPATPCESLTLALAARCLRRGLIVAHQCDIQLPRGLLNRLLQPAICAADRLVCRLAHRIMVLTSDYARNSRTLQPVLGKTIVAGAPIVLGPVNPAAAAAFRRRHAEGATTVIGFAARVATEKGLEHLLDALPRLPARLAPVRVLMTGDPREVIGERSYRQRLGPLLARHAGTCRFAGRLTDREMPSFFAACDVTVLPSVNRTESFGMVQVESMLAGTPVVASRLPGVREPVARTGMGMLVEPADPAALAGAVAAMATRPAMYRKPRAVIEQAYPAGETARIYHAVCTWLHHGHGHAPCPIDGLPADELWTMLEDMPPFLALVRSVECRLLRETLPWPGPVLDLGCGDGRFGEGILTAPAIGVDPDPRAVRRARRRACYREVRVAAAEDLPFEASSFGAVLANSALEHVADLDRALAEIHRVLQPGGRLLITAPGARFGEFLTGARLLRRCGRHRAATAYTRWFNRLARHRYLLSPADWDARLTRAGFRVRRRTPYLGGEAMRGFDVMHYLSVPYWILYRLTGRWIHVPRRAWERTLRARVDRALAEDEDGAYLLLVVEKRGAP